MKIEKKQREFIANDLLIDSWEKIKPYYLDLLKRELNSFADFEIWLKDRSELDAVLEEDAAWRYIKMTVDTSNEENANNYTFFVTKIQPELAPYEDLLNKKFIDSEFSNPEGKSKAFAIYHRSIQAALDIFREENIPLEAEVNEKSQEFGSISGAQTIDYLDQTMTMQKAALYLKEQDESVRKTVFDKMVTRRADDVDKLNDLYSFLIQKRHQIALNAGFDNFRDYKFVALGRFDYSKEDCFAFHKAIQEQIVPLVKKIQVDKLKDLGKEKFKPWDLDVDPKGLAPLKPFKTGNEMLEGTIKAFNSIDPYFGECLSTMADMGYLDLESKPGKAPGGYNYPLYEIGVPFIFMNAVGAQRDLVTMVHEGGHAIHSFLSRELELTGYKNLPSEVAELASMSMELLSMKEWKNFYSNEQDLKRAMKEQLEGILKVLPWIATIDEFQHWVYEHPHHTIEERNNKWLELGELYGTGLVDWSGYEEVKVNNWQRQMHLFEVPFYYIEYGIAQLGALSVWMNSLSNYDAAIVNYKNALRLGYTETIPTIYETAGIKFDFSTDNINRLSSFVEKELEKLSA